MKPQSSHRGFTLIEIMIAMTLLSMVMIGAFAVFMQANKALFVSTGKGNINRDIRTFTGELTSIARNANHFFIYNSIDVGDRNQITDRKTMGNTGDFLVLIFQEEHPSMGDPVHITRITGYYRDASANARGPIRKFDIHYAPADYKLAGSTQVEDLIPSKGFLQSQQKVAELSEGLANGQLFLNYEDRSIMVKGQIIHGNDYKRLTDTYNFTITPRG